jgi:hypothetical protein
VSIDEHAFQRASGGDGDLDAATLTVTSAPSFKPNLNTTFRELVDLKKELAKFMPAWHYALGGRGAF